MLNKIRRYLTLNMDFAVDCLQQWLFMSSREPGIKRSHSFLCLFIIFTAQKCPLYQSSVSLKWPYSWWCHKHSFRPLASVPQDPSVLPRVPLFVPSFPSVCRWVFLFLAHTSWTVVVVVKWPWAKVSISLSQISRLSSSEEKAILLSCSVKTSWWWLWITFIGLGCCLSDNKQFL